MGGLGLALSLVRPLLFFFLELFLLCGGLLLAYYLHLHFDDLVTDQFAKLLSKLLGVEVSVARVRVRPHGMTIDGLTVPNPDLEGVRWDFYAFLEMRRVVVRTSSLLDTLSLAGMHQLRVGAHDLPVWLGFGVRRVAHLHFDTLWMYVDEKEQASIRTGTSTSRSNLSYFSERLKYGGDRAAVASASAAPERFERGASGASTPLQRANSTSPFTARPRACSGSVEAIGEGGETCLGGAGASTPVGAGEAEGAPSGRRARAATTAGVLLHGSSGLSPSAISGTASSPNDERELGEAGGATASGGAGGGGGMGALLSPLPLATCVSGVSSDSGTGGDQVLASPLEALRRMGERQKQTFTSAVKERLVGRSEGDMGMAEPQFGAFLHVQRCDVSKLHLQHGEVPFRLEEWSMSAPYRGDSSAFVRTVLVGMLEKAMNMAMNTAKEAMNEKMQDTAAAVQATFQATSEAVSSNLASVGQFMSALKESVAAGNSGSPEGSSGAGGVAGPSLGMRAQVPTSLPNVLSAASAAARGSSLSGSNMQSKILGGLAKLRATTEKAGHQD